MFKIISSIFESIYLGIKKVLGGIAGSLYDSTSLEHLQADLNKAFEEHKKEAIALGELFLAMIRGEVTDPEALAPLGEAAELQGISRMPARVKCAVLGWHTMEEMLKGKKQPATTES